MRVLLLEYITAHLNLFSNTPVCSEIETENVPYQYVFSKRGKYFLENYFKT